VCQDFINDLRENFGHNIVASALQKIIVFELNSGLHECLKCFAVQASITAEQHILSFVTLFLPSDDMNSRKTMRSPVSIPESRKKQLLL